LVALTHDPPTQRVPRTPAGYPLGVPYQGTAVPGPRFVEKLFPGAEAVHLGSNFLGGGALKRDAAQGVGDVIQRDQSEPIVYRGSNAFVNIRSIGWAGVHHCSGLSGSTVGRIVAGSLKGGLHGVEKRINVEGLVQVGNRPDMSRLLHHPGIGAQHDDRQRLIQ
jgi:hypothetical protein